jgi:MFS family permease
MSTTTTEKPNLTPYHWKTLWASTAGYAMDGLDLMVLSYVLPFVVAALKLNSAQAGFIATATLIGAVIGGYTFGILADIFGRIKTFSLSILIFSVFTGLTAFTHDIFWFDVTRFIAGIGLGGEFGIGMTLVCEVWPKKYRSRATGVVASGYMIGMIGALIASLLLVPRFGWQSAFIIGALPALFAWWSRRNLEEPEMWKQHKSKGKTKFPLRHLFDSRKKTGTTIGLIIITSVQNFGFFGIMTWLPTMLSKQLHFTFNKSLTWTLVTILGMLVGILVFGYFSDLVGRRKAFMTFQVISALMIWVFFQQTNSIVLLILGAVMGFFVDGMMAGYGATIAEHYPTEARSTAENFIFNTGRAVGGFGPFVIGYLALTYPLSWCLGLLSSIYIIAALSVYFLIPESKHYDLSSHDQVETAA